jgi:hypothetical protein
MHDDGMADCFVVDAGVGDEVEVGCRLCAVMGTRMDDGGVDWHRLGAEAASGLIIELVDLVKMASEGSAVGESFDAQGALVDVWEMCLHVEGSLERVVRPIGTVNAGVTAAGS